MAMTLSLVKVLPHEILLRIAAPQPPPVAVPIGQAPGEPVVIRCALEELPGTDGVAVVGASIVIDGPAGGAVAAHASGPAVSLEATGTITIDAASVAAHFAPEPAWSRRPRPPSGPASSCR
jgi:hypothetical protein